MSQERKTTSEWYKYWEGANRSRSVNNAADEGWAEVPSCLTGINYWDTSVKCICLSACQVTATKFRPLLDILSETIL